MKPQIITLALISVFATPASAMMDTEWTPPPSSSSLSGVGLGDLHGNYSGGVVGFEDLPRVTVTCGVMCREQGVVILHPNGNNKIYVGGTGPLPMTPGVRDASGRDLTPEEQEKQKQKCLADCATQATVAKNNCAISNAQFAAKTATTPIWASVGGAILGGLVFKAPGVVGGFIGGDLLATVDRDARVKDQLSFCLAVAARDNNDCITKTCKAWLVALPLLLRRRREDEDKTVIA